MLRSFLLANLFGPIGLGTEVLTSFFLTNPVCFRLILFANSLNTNYIVFKEIVFGLFLIEVRKVLTKLQCYSA